MVKRVKSARVLGLIIQDDMKWNEHVNNSVKKAGKRLYMLKIFKRSNANIETLLAVYTTVIRPVLEYASQVWHFNIPNYLCKEIEVVQNRALRVILPSLSYSKSLGFTKMLTLKERHNLCDKFFANNYANLKLNELLLNKTLFNYKLGSGG